MVTGQISTIAGNGTAAFAGDGGAAASASLKVPKGLAFDQDGNLYIADSGNYRVRKVTAATGIISTVAGTGSAAVSGDGGPGVNASFSQLSSLAINGAGDLFIGDLYVIRVLKNGTINTYAGNGSPGVPVFGIDAVLSPLPNFSSFSLDGSGSIYLANAFPGSAMPTVIRINAGTHKLSPAGTMDSSTLGAIAPDFYGNLAALGTSPKFIYTDGAALTFASTHIGVKSVSQSVGLTNIGTQALSMASLGFRGGAASSFSQTNDCGDTLAANSTCTIKIVYQPVALGAAASSLTLDDAAGEVRTVRVTGTGLTAQAAVLSPNILQFGSVELGSVTPPQTMTLSNPGTQTLTIGSVSIPASFPYTTNCGTTLAAGTSCTFNVRYAPANQSSTSTYVSIYTNASEGSVSAFLGGTPIVTYQLTADRNSLDFGSHARLSSSVRTITLANSGSGSIYSASTAIAGADATSFSVTSTCYFSQPAGSCPLQITFKPTRTGPAAATLTISSYTGMTPVSISLSGSGAGPIDIDKDERTDYAIYRPSSGTWFLTTSGDPFSNYVMNWGLSTDIPMPGDYDGDGVVDIAVWRPSDGNWYVVPSTDPSHPIVKWWGMEGDVPMKGDYDGDGKLDFIIYRKSEGMWYVAINGSSTTAAIHWGLPTDIPLSGDFDGDGRTDIAIWRPDGALWCILPSSTPNSPIVKSYGLSTDTPVTGDFDGDGKTDIGIFGSNGNWAIEPSSKPGTMISTGWGMAGDIPILKDYDGDGKTDISVWRPSDGNWYTIPSSEPKYPAVRWWGMQGDIPLY